MVVLRMYTEVTTSTSRSNRAKLTRKSFENDLFRSL